nr:hypothetical protein [Tanacetum cinerariifolium]
VWFLCVVLTTNNNLRTLSNTSRANQDNSPRINRNAGHESQRSGNVVGARETVEYVYKTYLIEQDAHNVIIESVDMNYDSEQIDQNDEDADLAKERELLASLIKKLKFKIDESKNRNKFFETSNKFKEANNKLSEENDLMYADFKKSQVELKRRDSIEYAS